MAIYDAEITVRFAEQDGRLVASEIYAAPASVLADVSVSYLEMEANAPRERSFITARINLPGPDLATLASYYSTTFGDRKHATDDWVSRSFLAQLPGNDDLKVPLADLADLAPNPSRPRFRTNPRIKVPARSAVDGGYGEKFYMRVAQKYMELCAAGERAPNKRIAEASAVEITQVARWVKEARRRDLLPPGRKGKRG